MTTFTAWKFDTPEGADHAAGILRSAEHDGLIAVLDHAVVSWPEGASGPSTTHSHDSVKRGAGWGAFWGLLLGGIVLVPLAGAAVGAGIGAYNKAHEGVGLTEGQVEKIRNELVEGTSVLFAVTDKGDLDRVGERFRGMHSTLVATNLTDTERQELLEAFGDARS